MRPTSNYETPALHLPGFDAVVDLVGNPARADLVLYFNGNQFMAVPELVQRFQAAYPFVHAVYYETLPPGLLQQQILAGGRLQIGSLELHVPADVYTAGRQEMEDLAPQLGNPVPYAQNRLALLVPLHNPAHIRGLADLGRSLVRVAMPNPATEGIARLARQALDMAGGQELAEAVFVTKARRGETRFTTVHHRETLQWIVDGQADVGVVWQSEAQWASRAGQAVETILLDVQSNPAGRYLVAGLRSAPHPAARDAFLTFMESTEAKTVYARYGFEPVGPTPDLFSGF
ncbi:MAG: substrate-binding domain-containing protein [Thermaerobacter sp.]|nr:substrate-binding domain-containing protein [Thermaerobacter sp.]